MTDKDQQLDRFREAVEEKKAEAEEASRAQPDVGPATSHGDDAAGIQQARIEAGRPQDTFSVRDKNTGKGKKTADKWNQ